MVDNRTIFGQCAVALQGARDPVLMYSSWVYAPDALSGLRPSPAGGGNATRWRLDTTRVLKYNTLLVASTRDVAPAAGGAAPPRVDSLLYWNEKPAGIAGQCALIGFNSQARPDPSGAGFWRRNLTDDCINVNDGATTHRWFSISADGATAAAFTTDSDNNFTFHGIDAQTGAVLWRHVEPSPPPAEAQGWLSYGIQVARGGAWATFNVGTAGLTPQFFYVLDARTGAVRADPVVSPGLLQPQLSDDGALLCASEEAAPQLGAFSVHRWDEAAGAYAQAGAQAAPVAPSANGWRLVKAVFSADAAANRTLLAVAWLDAGITGPNLVALYDAAHVERGPLVSYLQRAVAGSGYATDDLDLSCAEHVCACGFWSQAVDGSQTTLVVLSAKNATGPVLEFATPGSISAVSVARASGGDAAAAPFFVGAAGCSSIGSCIRPGGDAYLWSIAA